MPALAIYPGTFDPVTYGHIDLIKRACRIFSKVIVAVAHASGKDPLFSVAERVKLLKQATSGISGVEVEDFDGLVVDYARKKSAGVSSFQSRDYSTMLLCPLVFCWQFSCWDLRLPNS